MKKTSLATFFFAAVLGGCANQGATTASGLGAAVAQNPTLNAMGQAALGAAVQSQLGNSPLATVLMNSMLGNQLPSADQQFRQQAWGNVLQGATGVISGNQPLQVQNPSTGNTMSINTLGQTLDPRTQQPCKELEESFNVGGKILTEKHRACLDASSGRWVLVQ